MYMIRYTTQYTLYLVYPSYDVRIILTLILILISYFLFLILILVS